MDDSLGISTDSFGNLQQQHVCVLVRLLSQAGLASREHVKRRYEEQASHFDQTLAFLKAIHGVEARGDSLQLNKSLFAFSLANDTGISHTTLHLLTQHESVYRRRMRKYLGRFRLVNGVASYQPLEKERSAESGVRNYLIELGVIAYDGKRVQYVLLPEHSGLYAESLRPHRTITPAQLKARLLACEELGLRAEEEVLAYERERVGHLFQQEVRHVAAHDVAAGYDVLSVTVGSNGDTVPRYIEVKAVPRDTLRFYWTANELVMAELFASWYYLYLVPAGPSGCLDISGVRIMADPFSTVLGTDSEWAVERGIVRCSLGRAKGNGAQ